MMGSQTAGAKPSRKIERRADIIESLNMRIAELEATIEKVAEAIKKAFPSLLACDGVLIVPVDRYNDIVKAFKQAEDV